VRLEFEMRRVDCRQCGGVKQERLDWLADNPHYTRRFALYVGKQCRSASIKEVAEDLQLDWHAVKAMDKLYMQEQLQLEGTPTPRVIGIDEISIRKGHVYRIIVSDLEAGRPIWFGGEDRSEASMAMFYAHLGVERTGEIRLAMMDTWKAFRKATVTHAHKVAILYDKFHVLRQLGRQCRVLPAREQSCPRFCRRAEQQNPRDSTPLLRLRDKEYLRLKILTSTLPALPRE